MKSNRHTCGLVILIAAIAVTSPGLAWQDTPGVVQSYAQARRLLDDAIAAHGGLDALRAARRMRVKFAGHDVWRHQSRSVTPPYDREPFTSDLLFDLDRGRLIHEQTRSYPGGIHRAYRFITDGDRSFYVNHRNRTYSVERYPKAETQTGNLYYVPQFVLLAAHDAGYRLRALGPIRLSSGALVDAITTATANGQLTLGFDRETRRLHSTMGVGRDLVAGETGYETEFLGYRQMNGVLLPTRRVSYVAGEMTADHLYTDVTPNYDMPDHVAQPPAGYTEAGRTEPVPVRALADNIWTVGNGAASLVVAFATYVLVVDAPPSTATDTIAKIASLAAGKPIRYVVPTHHHDDHAGGVRAYARAGATVVTTPANRAFLEGLVAAPVEVIGAGKRVFSEEGRTVEIHDIGPGPHADEMLVAWVPEDGILFQADLIDVSPSGIVLPGSNNETTQHFGRWLRGRGWQVRTFAGAHGSLPNAAAFGELLSQPPAARQ